MLYLIAFLEGFVTFISPCLLPMLPLYLLYFAGQDSQTGAIKTENEPYKITDLKLNQPIKGSKKKEFKTLINAVAFVIGFTLVFVLMGAFAGSLGGFIQRRQRTVDLLAGFLITLFGLSFMELLPFAIFKGQASQGKVNNLNFWSSLLFGIVFSVGWTPCVGVFLGSALVLASRQGSILQGILMLLAYSLGLGIPFIISALLVEKLKTAFQWIKGHYRQVSFASGLFLIIIGIFMMTGHLGRLLNFLS